jgi:hypothetical protein
LKKTLNVVLGVEIILVGLERVSGIVFFEAYVATALFIIDASCLHLIDSSYPYFVGLVNEFWQVTALATHLVSP